MAKNKKDDKSSKKKSKVHKDLEGFEIKVNEHGEIISNYSIDKINDFLNQNVEDKKLVKRDAAEKAKREEEEYHIEEGDEVEETDEDFVRTTTSTSDAEDDPDLPKARRRKGGEDEGEDDED
ncbi:hypothetical protein DXT99_14510 [Pontibacter diazotrophicus]|uniref:Uncharacterized protein n=1 Tax=Pontibacter diazotrophicus TaxID=1400979 RepID=A0A3D8LAJ3_9BACT|nr:hypothetical protein [Pontibacter diazotrophicus]RDV14336.1 hypothetical protein DXT99_14510 [Pontibacter diazotrophicus]